MISLVLLHCRSEYHTEWDQRFQPPMVVNNTQGHLQQSLLQQTSDFLVSCLHQLCWPSGHRYELICRGWHSEIPEPGNHEDSSSYTSALTRQWKSLKLAVKTNLTSRLVSHQHFRAVNSNFVDQLFGSPIPASLLARERRYRLLLKGAGTYKIPSTRSETVSFDEELLRITFSTDYVTLPLAGLKWDMTPTGWVYQRSCSTVQQRYQHVGA